jgi:hypothetical protein
MQPSASQLTSLLGDVRCRFMQYSTNNSAPPSHGKTDPWIFRDGGKICSGNRLLQDLTKALQKYLVKREEQSDGCGALIRSGMLESALADAGSASAKKSAALTDALSSDLFSDNAKTIVQAAQDLERVSIPDTLVISPPEGFSYYAVHPLDFATAAQRLLIPGEPAAIVGIRSIGVTLSAVVAAALKAQGSPAERMTVRPVGHPYDRVTHLSAEHSAWIRQHLERNASFIIVDEGPGRSGSTFLSVGEALVRAGVPIQRITLLGSHEPDAQLLCTRDAGQRWPIFRFRAAPRADAQFENCTFLGAGEWRKVLLERTSEWPPSWPQMERLKFLSGDGRDFFKFEGLSPAADSVRARAEILSAAGFACVAQDAGRGFSCYPVVKGRAMSTSDVSEPALEHIARYCAFRCSSFRERDDAPAALEDMLRFNLAREFQVDLPLDVSSLCENVIVVDGRMQPHEWIRAASGHLLKTDAISHGDDHFFPGPTDIAWDLAGAAVEWELSQPALEFLLSRFRQFTGDDAAVRLPVFLLAYTVFRLAWCEMALTSVRHPAEVQRLRSAAQKYRNRVRLQLRKQNWWKNNRHGRGWNRLH